MSAIQTKKTKNKSNLAIIAIPFVMILLVMCSCIAVVSLVNNNSDDSDNGDGNNNDNAQRVDGPTVNIISGSENESLEPILTKYANDNGFNVDVNYKGSVDIMLKLDQDEVEDIDAVWPASSVWLNLTESEKVKHDKSIMRTPVVLSLKKSIAEELDWVGEDKNIKVEDLLKAINDDKLSFAMTNSTQSNSGLSGYLAFLYAFAGNPDVLSMEDLQDDEVKSKTKEILKGINRSSGSSGWLKDLMLEKYDTLDAMINYEALAIEANQELINQGKEPLYTVYLENGLVVADSPLAYVDKGDDEKEELFLKLQEFLLSEDAQKQILQNGRRTDIGLSLHNYDKAVFDSDWGIRYEINYTTIKYPQKDVIAEMLNLYQVSLRKPSYTVYLLDVSGSMQGDGINQLKEAMTTLIDQDISKKYFLQASSEDIHVVIPFNGAPLETQIFTGNSDEEMDKFLREVNNLEAGGGTDIYEPLLKAYELINNEEEINKYFPAVILMSDGKSQNENKISQLPDTGDIPVFPIMFGQASEEQLDVITEITSGRVFDGRENLVDAFRKAKGYN